MLLIMKEDETIRDHQFESGNWTIKGEIFNSQRLGRLNCRCT